MSDRLLNVRRSNKKSSVPRAAGLAVAETDVIATLDRLYYRKIGQGLYMTYLIHYDRIHAVLACVFDIYALYVHLSHLNRIILKNSRNVYSI